jgi:hypothetical protein
MQGDPRGCRENAARCAELAAAAKAKHLKVMLVELSRSWEKLAIDLESVLDTIEFRDLALRWDALAIQLRRLHRVVKRHGVRSPRASARDATIWNSLFKRRLPRKDVPL